MGKSNGDRIEMSWLVWCTTTTTLLFPCLLVNRNGIVAEWIDLNNFFKLWDTNKEYACFLFRNNAPVTILNVHETFFDFLSLIWDFHLFVFSYTFLFLFFDLFLLFFRVSGPVSVSLSCTLFGWLVASSLLDDWGLDSAQANAPLRRMRWRLSSVVGSSFLLFFLSP
jgi:hypothetical protein